MDNSNPNLNQANRGEEGITLVELMTAMVLVVVTMLMLQSTLFSAVKARVANKTQAHRNELAYDFMQRMKRVPFGTAVDVAASAKQLQELFDDNQSLGTITLKQLETAAATVGHTFESSQDGTPTNWRVLVTNDLDSNGTSTGFREGRSDVLVIEIYAEEVLMLRTIRAADFPNTVKD